MRLPRLLRVTPFLRLIWLLPLAYALHEAEEWNILAWYRAYWTNVGALTDLTVRTWLVFSSVVGFAVTGALAATGRPRLAGHVLLVFFGFSFLHSFLHVYWVMHFGAYNPGVVTAVALVIPASVVVAVRAVGDGYVRPWFLALACVLNLPQFVLALRAGNAIPDAGLPWYRLSARIATALFGAPQSWP